MAYNPIAVPDETAFTAGTSAVLVPDSGVFNDSLAALTSGQQGAGRFTPNRARHVNLRNQAGTEIGTSSNPVRTDPTGTTKQPVLLYDAAGNAITSTSSALDENFKLIGGTAVDTNSGNKSAGTQRVVLATDQPAMTNAQPVTPNETYSGSVVHPKLRGNLFASAGVAGTTPVTLATGAPGYFVTGFRFSYNQATFGSVAEIVITLVDSVAGNIAVGLMMIPTAVVSTFIDLPKIDSWPGYWWNNKNNNSVLTAALNVNLSAGSIFVQVTYGLCNFVG